MKLFFRGVAATLLLLVALAGGGWVFLSTRSDDALATVQVSRAWINQLYMERMKGKQLLLELQQQNQELQKQLQSMYESRRA